MDKRIWGRLPNKDWVVIYTLGNIGYIDYFNDVELWYKQVEFNFENLCELLERGFIFDRCE